MCLFSPASLFILHRHHFHDQLYEMSPGAAPSFGGEKGRSVGPSYLYLYSFGYREACHNILRSTECED